MRKYLLALAALICTALPAHAAGGTCPSGANYTNPTNPAGSLVTLSSFGITSCYYISDAGADTNTGTDETHPFLHAPGMSNCGNNCSASLMQAGIGFIFRGGDTWHYGNSGAAPYAGTPPGCSANNSVPAGLCLGGNLSGSGEGTSSHPIYYGVDITWFTGGSWVRPIFTADNSPCGPTTTGTMPDGATCTGTTDSFGQPSYSVSSCPYQVGTANTIVDEGFASYYIVDNFELSGLCQSGAQQGRGGSDSYFRYASAQAPIYFTNNYIHGASHLPFAGKNGFPPCNAPAVCINVTAFQGSVSSSSTGETIAFNDVNFADSDPGGEFLCFAGFWNVAYNHFAYTTSCLPDPMHVFHDNLYEYFFENGHSDLMQTLEPETGAIYNNVFRHIENLLSSGGGAALWFGPQTGITDYIFNNIMYDVGGLEYLNMGGVGDTTNNGNYTWFNNTFQSNVNQPIFRCSASPLGTVLDTNDHYIDDGGAYLGLSGQGATIAAAGGCTGGSGTSLDSLTLTNATATSDGYTSSQTYAYSPTSGASPTVGAGTNEYSGYCSTLLASSDPLIQAAGTACRSDTSYGISYNATTHVVTIPGRTATARPTSAAFDIGGYQFNAGGGSVTLTPSSQYFGSITVGNPSSPVTFTFTNNNGSSATSVSASNTGTNSGDWAISSNTCTGTITSMGTCTLVETATPGGAGSRSATLSISYSGADGASPVTAALTATGVSSGGATASGLSGGARISNGGKLR